MARREVLGGDEKTVAVVRVEELWKKTSRADQYVGLPAKAARLLEALEPADRDALSSAMDELKQALLSEDAERIDRAESALIDAIFDGENKLR